MPLSEIQEQQLAVTVGTIPFEYEDLGGGRTSQAVRIGAEAIKISHRSLSLDAAEDLQGTMQTEYELGGLYLGDHWTPTEFEVVPDIKNDSKFKVVTRQPFQPGVMLDRYVTQPDADFTSTIELLRRALWMHEDSHKIIDIACIEGGMFDVKKSGNIVVDENHHARSIDTTFGNLQRKPVTSKLFTAAIAWGARRGLREFEQRQAA